MNDRLALIITLTYMTAIVLVIAADAFIIGEAIAHAFNNGHAIAIIYVAALLVLATWLNLRGIKLAGAAEQVVTTVVVLGTVSSAGRDLTTTGRRRRPGAGSSPVQALILGHLPLHRIRVGHDERRGGRQPEDHSPGHARARSSCWPSASRCSRSRWA